MHIMMCVRSNGSFLTLDGLREVSGEEIRKKLLLCSLGNLTEVS